MNPALVFVLLTNYVPTAAEMKSARNLRYLNKREVSDISIVVEAIESALRAGESSEAVQQIGKLAALTSGQLEVLAMLARGLSNREIAIERNVGLRAVEQTIHRIYQTLGLGKDSSTSSRVSAARIYTAEMGLRQSRN